MKKTKKKEITIFEVYDIHIPDGSIVLFMTKKEDFIKWVDRGWIYRMLKEGTFRFYAFTGDGLVATYTQKEAEL